MGNNPQDFENNLGSALQVIDETAMEPTRALSTQEQGLPSTKYKVCESPDKILPNVNY